MKMTHDSTMEIIEFLAEFQEDSTVPKNVKAKIQKVAKILEGTDDISIKVDRALLELDDIQNDTNIQSYVRTQIWNIVSMLEGL